MRELPESQSKTLIDLHTLAAAERDAREGAERSARRWQFATLTVGVMTLLAAVAAVIVALERRKLSPYRARKDSPGGAGESANRVRSDTASDSARTGPGERWECDAVWWRSVVSPPVLLVHVGLGDEMNAERFWCRPGILAGLRAAGFDVAAPDRDTCPSSWTAAADALAAEISRPTTVVASSNAVSVAVRLAIQYRPLVDRLVLLWPATCGDPVVDAATPPEETHLLAGDTMRGVVDDELGVLDVPTAVMASDPPTRVHAQGCIVVGG
jgi:pimeloyl-ACP methyl ester carboxylesterase